MGVTMNSKEKAIKAIAFGLSAASLLIALAVAAIAVNYAIEWLSIILVNIDVKFQAFERGYMVECLGKTGYYWECEE